MALDNASADRAVGLWLDGFDPPLDEDGRARVRAQLGPLVRVLWQVIREDAVVLPGTMSADPDTIVQTNNHQVVGAGTVA